MSNSINIKSASISALQQAQGESIRLQIQEWGSIKDFIEYSGVSKATLYRVFSGHTVGSDVILKIYQSLGKTDVLTALTAKPKPNPLTLLKKTTNRPVVIRATVSTGSAGQSTTGFALSGMADPRKLGLSRSALKGNALIRTKTPPTKSTTQSVLPKDNKR